MNRRISNQKVDLNYNAVQKFFEDRGEKNTLKHKYNYVLFQDDNPELAVKRDEIEKKKISVLLGLENRKNLRILDIGCGIGRWGEDLLVSGHYYVGIDGSRQMIEHAKENLKEYENKKLLVGMFQNFLDVLKDSNETEPFDMIFVNGVFMYLNDKDYRQALSDILCISKPYSFIYVKESAGIEERLTLDQIYSDGLGQNYSAVYRSVKEYQQSLSEAWSDIYELVSEGLLFDSDLMNRKDTADYYFIWKREI